MGSSVDGYYDELEREREKKEQEYDRQFGELDREATMNLMNLRQLSAGSFKVVDLMFIMGSFPSKWSQADRDEVWRLWREYVAYNPTTFVAPCSLGD